MKKYVITIIILFAIILLSIGGYFIYSQAKTNKSNSTNTLKEKGFSEIEFLSLEIVSMMNQINNISYSNFKMVNEEIPNFDQSQENSIETENTINNSKIESDGILTSDNSKIDWNSLKNKIESMYSSWTTVMMDLSTLNVNKENLTQYNNIMDEITKSFEKEDKKASLTHLSDLHNLLSQYLKDFSDDSQKISVFTVKSYILYAYSYCEQDDWDNVTNCIAKAKQEFSNILNNQMTNVNDIDIINKAYILINELEKNSKNKDKDIFYINYSNLMQELENIG